MNRMQRLALESVLWHALAKHADKQADRDRLQAGQESHVSILIAADVDGERMTTEVHGKLLVNHDTTRATSTSAVKAEHVLALALAKMPEATREKLFEELPQQYLAGALPEPCHLIARRCGQLLEKLRQVDTKTYRGTVRFEPAADPPPAAHAATEERAA